MRRSVQTAAAGGKEAAGPPLQEQDDRQQYENLSEHRVEENLLERLIGQADPERAYHRAKNAADPAHDHGHETIDDVFLSHRRTHRAELGHKHPGKSGESASKTKRQ